MHRNVRAFALGIATALTLSSPARADVADGPEPDPECEPVPECVGCPTGYDEESDAEYEACVAAAEAEGLVRACSEPDRYGPGSTDYYCPPGVDIAAGGCSVVPGLHGELVLVSAGVVVAAAAMLRARRRRAPKA
jgi:hypothetical protein